MKRQKVNLNRLAGTLAGMDNPRARNEDVVASKTFLASFGKLLRACDTAQALEILNALVSRAGKRSK